MFQNKNLAVLGSNLLFKGLDESVINLVFNSKNFHAEKEGELIFQADDKSNYIYLILQGEVKLKYSGTRGSQASFRRIKNEFFGEQEVLEKTNRITSAVADTDCIFYLISSEEIFKLISEHRKILKNLSYTPVEEEEILDENISHETMEIENQELANKESAGNDVQEKHLDEIIMDEDLADYSFNSPDIEELRDFNNENYLSYSNTGNEKENSKFNNNGFHPEEEFKENPPDEIIAGQLLNDEFNDTLPDNTEKYFPVNDPVQEEELLPAVSDFDNIPEEPQKFAFAEDDNLPVSNNFNDEVKQNTTETITLIESVSKFISGNINFPLNEIQKLSNLLSKCSTLPEAPQVGELIKKHISSVQTVVKSAFEFISQKNNLNLERKNIKDVLSGILNLTSEYVETRKVNLYKKIDTDAVVNVDEASLFNVFSQLAKNACDSMPEGGNIFVTAAKENDNVKIEFIDEGMGIPSSLSVEVFEPAFTHGKENGSGLGLSIAKKIIQDHNGDISVDGELGEGTRIIVTLPVAAVGE